MNNSLQKLILRLEAPDFLDLPWQLPLTKWPGNCERLEEVYKGLSRHPVLFINYSGVLYALKELPGELAKKEYDLLLQMEELHLPVVTPVGFAFTQAANPGASQATTSVLITRYLDRSLPYRSLFMTGSLKRYREHLLDAIAGLLVQLHLAGVYWGDCSLSNTLFRRDAGALRAYLVDAETAEVYLNRFPAASRFQDLQIMEDNVDGDLLDLATARLLARGVPISDTGEYIRLRYQRLWAEVSREETINPGEHYRIQERIRALNALGFSVGNVELVGGGDGGQLRLRVLVTDRNFHSDQLHDLTGLDVEEMQARKMMNEIQELKATLSQVNNRSTPLSAAAYHWLENIYQPTVELLQSMIDPQTSPAELYCQVLEHKWYLSEQARHDVGHRAATEDFLKQFGNERTAESKLN
jgi:hypothetical protein